ncbi:peptidoglycan DD-metalloendopeptidase family protein [Rhabdaerophilum sp. SD176]|uniref:peptidoglycan DD-metalloendopeptidase family protein n=1 Tax=Rhabdaerophilum sp. SD176 TaxID=2983548 RepID=UPI0024E00DF0|nr:peptidoglycan DD-metalloendopeptidase family protein [Rhabdaerophilum sp. SD176]
MREFQWISGKRKLLATVMAAGLLGACSSDVTRFDNDPFKNPFRSRAAYDPVQTNSINRPTPGPRSLEPVRPSAATTQPLPPPNQPIMATNPSRANAPLTTGSVSAPNYVPLAPVAERPATALGPASSTTGWSAVGGTPVVLREGESLNTLSARYNVPVNALMAVNGISNVNQARPGQQIMIPAYSPVSAARAPVANSVIQRPAAVQQPMPAASARSAPAIPARVAEAPKPADPVRIAPVARQVQPAGQSDAEKRAAAKLEVMRRQSEEARLKQQAEAATARKLAEARAAERKARAEAEKAKAQALVASRKSKADEEPATTASIPEAKPVPARTQPMPEKEAAAPAEASETPNFRWPARGRVISGFGARGTGGANDGINIALPEGTPVRAAEGGTVVHADDALKGYGKLVLIRHPSGYVSVYAHNSELKVKRGESVRRGQVIASSGQSGNVTAPQLHFEIRKGATPVDPNKYLTE